jgi:hypothetical protein
MMHTHDENMEILISGYLDGELDGETHARVEARLAGDAHFREEFERMKGLMAAADEAVPPLPEDAAWDGFLDGVYNRIERRTGWVLLCTGLLTIAVYGMLMFVLHPGKLSIKLLISLPVLGLAVLFFSVLRQRMCVAKTDRYSREIQR